MTAEKPEGDVANKTAKVCPDGKNNSNVALLPCPFCNGHDPVRHWLISQPVLEELSEDSGGGWRVNCYSCHIGTWNGAFQNRDEAIATWNRRESQATRIATLSEALRVALVERDQARGGFEALVGVYAASMGLTQADLREMASEAQKNEQGRSN